MSSLLLSRPPRSDSLPSLEEIQAELATRHLRDFIRQSWPIIEPGKDLLWNWHIDCLSEYLEAVTEGEITRLLVNMPPRYMKSIEVTVDWPTWVWLRRPESAWIFFSYSDALATKHSLDRRRIIQSYWYQQRWGYVYQMTSDQNVKTEYENDKRGVMIATGLQAGAHGKGGDILVFDDPHNPNEMHSETKRLSDLRSFGQASTRMNDKKTGAIVVVMQRVHESDISSQCIEQGYTHLCLPAQAEGRTTISLPSGKVYEREEGTLLWPEREGVKELAVAKVALGSYAYSGQYQQRPSPAGGGVLKRHWWRFWHYQGQLLPPVLVRLEDGTMFECPVAPLPSVFDTQVQSWDMAFKDTDASDFVAGGVFGQSAANSFLLDWVHERLDMPATLRAVENLSATWPLTRAKYVEDKANGSAVVQMLRNKIPGLIAVEPEGGKASRVAAVSPLIEAGNVYLPHPKLMPRVEEVIEECAGFPTAANDDLVDMITQALLKISGGSQGVFF